MDQDWALEDLQNALNLYGLSRENALNESYNGYQQLRNAVNRGYRMNMVERAAEKFLTNAFDYKLEDREQINSEINNWQDYSELMPSIGLDNMVEFLERDMDKKEFRKMLNERY